MVRGPLRQELDAWRASDAETARIQARPPVEYPEPKVKGPYYESNKKRGR